MCRSIKTLRRPEPAATDEEITAASLQFVRKISGFRKPSKANQAAFDGAVEAVAEDIRKLLESLPAPRAMPEPRPSTASLVDGEASVADASPSSFPQADAPTRGT